MRRRLEDCPATVTPLNRRAGKKFRRNQLKRKLQQPGEIYSRLPLLGHAAAHTQKKEQREAGIQQSAHEDLCRINTAPGTMRGRGKEH